MHPFQLKYNNSNTKNIGILQNNLFFLFKDQGLIVSLEDCYLLISEFGGCIVEAVEVFSGAYVGGEGLCYIDSVLVFETDYFRNASLDLGSELVFRVSEGVGDLCCRAVDDFYILLWRELLVP
jgi:hypothetical protein